MAATCLRIQNSVSPSWPTWYVGYIIDTPAHTNLVYWYILVYIWYIFSSKTKHLFTQTILIDRQTTEDEVVCQQLCQSFSQCSHFTFVENKYPLETGEPNLQCYLWKRCNKKVAFILLSLHWLFTDQSSLSNTACRSSPFTEGTSDNRHLNPTCTTRCLALQWTAPPQ